MPIELLLRCAETAQWRRYRDPDAVLEARSAGDVRDCLHAVDRAIASGRYLAAGLVAYEAAAAFGFDTHAAPAGDLPLVWFGLFSPDRVIAAAPPTGGGRYTVGPWSPTMDEVRYAAAVAAIRRSIEAGDTYQINLTFRLRAPFAGDPLGWFRDICDVQRGAYAACLDLGRHVICSASPELFFAVRQGTIVCEPMKGTAPRGRYGAEDRALAIGLRRSEKNRAENVMIVDVVRNDLGRVADIGSVRVPGLFDIRRFPNVWQMTSRVTARSTSRIPALFETLFPAASIVGAPKIRSATIIRALEETPRGIYTGAIGWIEPGGAAQFSVAIRTATLDRETGMAEYGVGSGIVWDSSPASEYDECRLKAEVVSRRMPSFDLVETLAWSPAGGFERLPLHLRRLRASAAYFGRRWDRHAVLAALAEAVRHSDGRVKVRLLLDAAGRCRATATPVEPEDPGRPLRAALARTPVDRADIWLYHKTTRRETHDRARAERPDCDEVLLWNTDGEITEGTVTNVVVEIDGDLVTPPVGAGLLAGTFRAQLLASGRVTERAVRIPELGRATRTAVVNAVRGWREVTIVE